MNDQLPSYTNPPLVETALSVMFRPIKGLGNADLGLFWASMREQYPLKNDAEPIETQIEKFGADVARVPRVPPFKVVPFRTATRLQMVKDDGHRMIQVQNGRFAYNWRRLDRDTYPHWSAVFREFSTTLDTFRGFLGAHKFGPIEPVQWEVAYVNQLLHERDWQNKSEWRHLVPGLVGCATDLPIASTEGLECSWRFVLPEERGRLHVELSSGFVIADNREVLTLQLTARGGVSEVDGWDLESGLQIGHRAVVKGFMGITGEDAQKRWGRTL